MAKTRRLVLKILFLFAGLVIIGAGILLVWLANAKIPDFQFFEERQIARSTKIYDRTGEILLYDIHRDIRRTVIPYEEMGADIKNATVAIEDSEFYQHRGIRLKSTLRAFLTNLRRGELSQGGSTITQQIVKNTLLTPERTINRKLKEWFIALKMERIMTKDEILSVYLNEAPYGGNIYGIQEAAQSFFGKSSRELTLAEAAYLAAIPKAPTFYSPYGENRDKLDSRKDTVLLRMKNLEFITKGKYEEARTEKVEFLPERSLGIQSPHFIFFVKKYLEGKYGTETVERGGLKVITTLDFELQRKAEEMALRHALNNAKNFNASNTALVAINPKTGEILSMVGSRNWFDEEIDGKFNVTTALRQPGSAFKPFVYATAFKKGYTPNSVVFDLRTEFFVGCDLAGRALPGYSQEKCYRPENYDNKYPGPVTLREALAQSRNVASVKLLYLVGVPDSIKTAREMGIKTLTDSNRYGLTLVLGGGEVKLLEMTSAFGIFAAGGILHPWQSILKVEDYEGNVLEEYQDQPTKVLEENVALLISDILADNEARTPLWGPRSFLYFDGRDVAGKTGTTDDKKDGWLIGYSTSIVTGVWSGNNDNLPMEKGSSISGPLWREFMEAALEKYPADNFPEPEINTARSLKPILRGIWQGGETFLVDKISGKLATESTPEETIEEKTITNVHDTLYWLNRTDPLGVPPADPASDPQFIRWESGVEKWWSENKGGYPIVSREDIPAEYDDAHTLEKKPKIAIIEPENLEPYVLDQRLNIRLSQTASFPIKKMDFFVNNIYLGSDHDNPFVFSFTPADLENIREQNEIKVIATDVVFNRAQTTTQFKVQL